MSSQHQIKLNYFVFVLRLLYKQSEAQHKIEEQYVIFNLSTFQSAGMVEW